MNLLIVDQSAAIRKILNRVLSLTDLPIKNLHEAHDGAKALWILENYEVSLVIADIDIPQVNGVSFLSRILGTPKWNRLPIVMLTSDGNQKKLMEAVQLGARGYIRKPFAVAQVKEKVLASLKSLEE